MMHGFWNVFQEICSTFSLGDYLTVASFVCMCLEKWSVLSQ